MEPSHPYRNIQSSWGRRGHIREYSAFSVLGHVCTRPRVHAIEYLNCSYWFITTESVWD